MKVDGSVGWELSKVGAEARELEQMGYSGILSAETAAARQRRAAVKKLRSAPRS